MLRKLWFNGPIMVADFQTNPMFSGVDLWFSLFFLNWLLNIWLIHNFKSVLFGGSNRQIQLMVFGSILLLVGALEHGWIMTFHSVGKFWTSQLTIRHIFQRGRAKNHQPDWFYGWIFTVTLKRLGGAMDVWISWRLNCWVFLAAVFGVFLAIDFHSLSRLNSEKTLTCVVKIRLILENQPLFASSNPKFPWPCGVCLRLRHLCPSRHLCGGAVAVG